MKTTLLRPLSMSASSNGRGTYKALAQRLREFEPRQGRQRRWAGKSRNILHLLSQQPAKTGSGVALLSLGASRRAAG